MELHFVVPSLQGQNLTISEMPKNLDKGGKIPPRFLLGVSTVGPVSSGQHKIDRPQHIT